MHAKKVGPKLPAGIQGSTEDKKEENSGKPENEKPQDVAKRKWEGGQKEDYPAKQRKPDQESPAIPPAYQDVLQGGHREQPPLNIRGGVEGDADSASDSDGDTIMESGDTVPESGVFSDSETESESDQDYPAADGYDLAKAVGKASAYFGANVGEMQSDVARFGERSGRWGSSPNVIESLTQPVRAEVYQTVARFQGEDHHNPPDNRNTRSGFRRQMQEQEPRQKPAIHLMQN